MTKRKAPTASKPARSSKVTAKAQRANSAVIRSSKPSRVRSVAADPIRLSPKGHTPRNKRLPFLESGDGTAGLRQTDHERNGIKERF